MKLLTAVAVLVTLLVASPAQADQANYYGKNARVVARDMGCAKTYKADPDDYYFSGGVCKIGSVKVGMATFRGPAKQAEYKARLIGVIKAFYPPGNYFMAADKGAIIVNRALSRKSAVLAHRRIGATIIRVHVR